MKRHLLFSFAVAMFVTWLAVQPFVAEAAYYSFGDPSRELLPVPGEMGSGHTVYYTVPMIPQVKVATGSSHRPSSNTVRYAGIRQDSQEVAKVPQVRSAPVPTPTATSTPVPIVSSPATPSPLVQKCERDSFALRSFVRQNVAQASNAAQSMMRLEQFRDYPNQIKSVIDDTSLRTGGKMRDIYVGGAAINDKRGMVEEYLRQELSERFIRQVEVDIERQVQQILTSLERELNRPAPIFQNQRGSASDSKSLRSQEVKAVRSGSFKLQQRNGIGLHEDVGRFSYEVRSRSVVHVRRVQFKQEYDACAGNVFGAIEYGAEVEVVPTLEVKYQFSHLGSSRARQRYRTFSGTFIILDRHHTVERDLSVYRPLL